MNIDILLSHLRNVKSTGFNRWIASCPTREDKTPSMVIRLLNDGRILLHDFGGASPGEILDAMGLGFSDLFPEKLAHHFTKERKPFSAMDILLCLSKDTTHILIAANKINIGKPLNENETKALAQAVTRISNAVEVAHGYP